MYTSYINVYFASLGNLLIEYSFKLFDVFTLYREGVQKYNLNNDSDFLGSHFNPHNQIIIIL